MEGKRWENIPEDILILVFQYLGRRDRCKAALVCRRWRNCFYSPLLWHSFCFKFNNNCASKTSCYEEILANQGVYLRNVKLICEQGLKINRENACKLIEDFSKLESRRLQSFELIFAGENPLFYSGSEFTICLLKLFKPACNGIRVATQLKNINLRRFPVAFSDSLFESLIEHNPDLESLNIQNDSLVCKVTPRCIHNIVKQCKKLKSLSLHYTSISEEVILALTEKDRVPLERLSVKCRREEKYARDVISGETWLQLKRNVPNLRVTFVFDTSCPMFKVDEILKPEIPLYNLILTVQARVVDQIYFVIQNFYETLERFVVSTTNSEELETALILLASQCNHLRELCVWQCYISQETKRKILELCPNLVKCVLKVKGEAS